MNTQSKLPDSQSGPVKKMTTKAQTSTEPTLNTTHQRMTRRDAIRWALAAAATLATTQPWAWSQDMDLLSLGYGSDPDLINPDVPWDRTLTEAQLQTVIALADIILPRVSEDSPAASELNVQDFIDEWISAPYPYQQEDRKIVLEGLEWLDGESKKRFEKVFAELDSTQQTAICDDICYLPKASAEMKSGAEFFAKFRDLTMAGYYTTDHGTKEVGYVGNVPALTFNGPPSEVLKRLGLDSAPW